MTEADWVRGSEETENVLAYLSRWARRRCGVDVVPGTKLAHHVAQVVSAECNKVTLEPVTAGVNAIDGRAA